MCQDIAYYAGVNNNIYGPIDTFFLIQKPIYLRRCVNKENVFFFFSLQHRKKGKKKKKKGIK